ncbi:MAG: alkaline phosphatase family protein [Planctomycetota bacterium]
MSPAVFRCVLRSANTAWRIAVFAAAILLGSGCACHAVTTESLQAEYLWMVTLDGLRPEELFTGADRRLIDKEIGGVKDPAATLRQFWVDDPLQRRRRLMPFFWDVVAKQGQVFGSVEHDSAVLVKNGRYFSYPGYQEILCGYPDDRVDSNDKKNNENVSVLEWLSQRERFANKVAAFASWDVFPYILNAERSCLYVNAGWQEIDFAENDSIKNLLNRSIRETPHYWRGARFDFMTFTAAMQYVRAKQPSVLYLALDETDDWCHDGRYDLYLEAARRSDQYLQELWEYAQSSAKYRDKTAMIITTDHGRGDGREGWKNHGSELPGSERIWMAVIGPDTPALGVRSTITTTQGQYAASAAMLLGEDFTTSSAKVAAPLPDIVASESRSNVAAARASTAK